MEDEVTAEEEFSLEQFVEQAYQDYERTLNELKEIDVLIKQSSAEVESLSQRNARVSNHLRQLQMNFDTIPREDIREGYEALINAQQRLFTMRGQLEKLQSDQRNLARLAETQQQLLHLTEGMTELPQTAQRAADQPNVIRVIETEEAARQSLVRRMHDGPASSLSNFILQAEICERFFETDPERAREELAALKRSAASTFGAVKNFIFDLRPMMLDDLGVVPTLRRYVEALEEKQEASISLTATGTVRRLEEHIEVTIFRAVQELINNARVHGKATDIRVVLDADQDQVTVTVEDNGTGFDASGVLEGEHRETIGLPMLRKRIEMLGGELRVQSTLGEGTRVEFRIPVQPTVL